MELHPAAQLFPPMSEAELEELVADIQEHGLLEPIITYQGTVLDGCNRLRACELARVQPHFREWKGEGGSPVAFVLSENCHRRHLTASQRAAIAVDALPLFEQEAKERHRALSGTRGQPGEVVANVPPPAPKSREQAAQLTGAGARYVQEAKAVKEADPELFAQVRAGQVTLRTAAKKLGRTPSGQSGKTHDYYARKSLKEMLDPLDKYLKTWDDSRLRGTTPAQARRLLAKVQRVNRGLVEVSISLEERTVRSGIR